MDLEGHSPEVEEVSLRFLLGHNGRCAPLAKEGVVDLLDRGKHDHAIGHSSRPGGHGLQADTDRSLLENETDCVHREDLHGGLVSLPSKNK